MKTIQGNCFCRICLKKDENEENDIRQLTFFERSAIEVFEFLFRIKINASTLDHNKVPRKICQKCQDDIWIVLAVTGRALKSHDIIGEIDLQEDDDTKIKEEPKLQTEENPNFESGIPQIKNEPEEIIIDKCEPSSSVWYQNNYFTNEKRLAVLEETKTEIPKTRVRLKTKEQYKCHHCPKIFQRKTKLTHHLNQHFNIRNYKCKLCRKHFAFAHSLQIHLRTHTGEKPFQCTICQKQFRQSGQLKSHLRSHSGERPFQCKLCSKSYMQMSGLKYHESTGCRPTPYSRKAGPRLQVLPAEGQETEKLPVFVEVYVKEEEILPNN